MKKFPTLYKLTSAGKTQFWTISVSEAPSRTCDFYTIDTEFGQVGGKSQSSSDLITNGKNIGKANETTPYEQALADMKSKWESKIKKGYVEDLKKAKLGKTDIIGGGFPMLAHKFSEHGHKIKYPPY